MKDVSCRDFVKMVKTKEASGFRSANFSLLFTETKPPLLKKSRVTKIPCPYSNVLKRVKSYAMLNVIYENAVNNKMVRKGMQEPGEKTFEAQSLPWGRYVKLDNGKFSKILIEHKGQMYFRATFNLGFKPETEYIVDGQAVSYDSLKEYLPEKDEALVPVRTFKAESVKEVHFDGEVYRVS